MEYIPAILIYGGIFCTLMYLNKKRLEDKKKENYEKREN